MKSQGKSEHAKIKVAVRLRPMLESEKKQGLASIEDKLKLSNRTVELRTPKAHFTD